MPNVKIQDSNYIPVPEEESDKLKKPRGRNIRRVADRGKRCAKTRTKNRLAKGISKKRKYIKKRVTKATIAKRKKAVRAKKNGTTKYVEKKNINEEELAIFNHGKKSMNQVGGDLILPERAQKKFTEDRRNAYIMTLLQTGSKMKACEAACVGPYTVMKYIKQNPKFRAFVKDILQTKAETLEEAMFNRATNGVEELVLYQGEPVMVKDKKTGKMIPLVKTSFPESTSQFLLKGNLPNKYNQDKKNTLEVSGPNGSPINIQHTQTDVLNLVQALKIAKDKMPVIDVIPIGESNEE